MLLAECLLFPNALCLLALCSVLDWKRSVTVTYPVQSILVLERRIIGFLQKPNSNLISDLMSNGENKRIFVSIARRNWVVNLVRVSFWLCAVLLRETARVVAQHPERVVAQVARRERQIETRREDFVIACLLCQTLRSVLAV